MEREIGATRRRFLNLIRVVRRSCPLVATNVLPSGRASSLCLGRARGSFLPVS